MKRIGILFFLVQSLSFATEILSVDFKPNIRYQDLDLSCKFAPHVKIFNLTVEMEDGQSVRGKLKRKVKGTSEKTLPLLELTESELGGIQASFFKTSQKYAIRHLKASERMLLFFFYQAHGLEKDCVPLNSIVEFSPTEMDFEFYLPKSDLEPLPYDAYSDTAVFKGLNQQQQWFRIEFSLIQAY